MPNMANITVKKNDGTTDVLWTALIPSAGDKSPAVWRSLTVGAAPAFQPSAEMQTSYNTGRTTRKVDVRVKYPTTFVDGSGRTQVGDTAIASLQFVLPTAMDPNAVNELVSQSLNLAASALMKDSIKLGYAPT